MEKKSRKHKRDIGRAHASAWALERQFEGNCNNDKHSFSAKDLKKLHKQASKLNAKLSTVKQKYKQAVKDNVMSDIDKEKTTVSLQAHTMTIQLLQSERRDQLIRLQEDLEYHEHKVISIKEDMENLKLMIEDTEETEQGMKNATYMNYASD